MKPVRLHLDAHAHVYPFHDVPRLLLAIGHTQSRLQVLAWCFRNLIPHAIALRQKAQTRRQIARPCQPDDMVPLLPREARHLLGTLQRTPQRDQTRGVAAHALNLAKHARASSRSL